jgi:hypothetical protein
VALVNPPLPRRFGRFRPDFPVKIFFLRIVVRPR